MTVNRNLVFDDGKVETILSSFQDLSEINRMARELEATQQVNREIIRIVTDSYDIPELSNLRERLEDTNILMDNYFAELAKWRKKLVESSETIYTSSIMKNVVELADKVAVVNSTVLIEGECGVGKGLIASRIHKFSKRKEQRFVTINCGAIPENLIESELFGYEGGAFTGAKREGKKGLMELAEGGTAFLDEIGELPLHLQVKLLQVIQEKRMMRVGGNRYTDVDVRIIAATNQNLQRLIKEKKFREDLYYRLNVVPLVIPPLRYRKEDVEILIDHFLKKISAKYLLQKTINAKTKELLVEYQWPGNVRELENLIERLMVTVDSNEILPMHLPAYILQGNKGPETVVVLDVCPLKNATEQLERQLLTKALDIYNNTYEVAAVLGVNQSTVVRKMQRYGIVSKRKLVDCESDALGEDIFQ